MKKVFLKLVLLSLPILILIGLFFVLDPFRIVYTYGDYSGNMYISLNREYVSSKMYFKNIKKYNYNSFILGSSRTLAFHSKSWRKFLSPDASPFVFDASGETLSGIYEKVSYIDKTAADFNNCLLIICTDHTFGVEADQNSHIFIKHPTIAGTSWFNFYVVFIKDYLNFLFLKNYFQFLFTHKYGPSMKGYIDYRIIRYDTVANDQYIIDRENEIKQDSTNYYEKRKDIFYTRDSIISPAIPQISESHVQMLKEIKSIFVKHHTNYKIIIGPLYNQVPLNSADLLILQNIFGKDNVFNFSGKNKFTVNTGNYYEDSHYRPSVGDSIMSIIYKKQ